jgi:hypothetical protein
MTQPATRIDGVAWFTILSIEHACLTAYSVDEFTSPPHGAADIMLPTDGINLLDDNNAGVNKSHCTAYTSATLTQASGHK